jgi:transketolase
VAWLSVKNATPKIDSAPRLNDDHHLSLGEAKTGYTPGKFAILGGPRFINENEVVFSDQELGSTESKLISANLVTGSSTVLLSDGELQEGATWESAQLANAEKLENLIVLVDVNGMQVDGPMAEIMPIGSPSEKFKAFGWQTVEIDGHDISAISKACHDAKEIQGPVAIICYTEPWRGFNFLEARWKLRKLHFIRLTDSEKQELADATHL